MTVSVQNRNRRRRRMVRRLFRLSLLVGVLAVIGGAVLLIGDQKGAGADAEASMTTSENDNNVNTIEMPDWVTIDLLPVNDYSRPGTTMNSANAIVIHYVGNPGTTAAQNRSYYSKLADTHETSASSNFLIGMDGEILECVPVNEVAYCSNWRNEDTISVECCHPDTSGKFTDDTYASLVKLTSWLLSALGLDSTDLIRHYDITQKECPKYFVDHEDAWALFKQDVQDVLDELQSQSNT